MRSSTLRGLICHTADEAGFYPGPDYEFGWGLANIRRAAELITFSQSGNQSIILQQNLSNNTVYSTNVYAVGNQPLMATICWNDPASNNTNSNMVDPTFLNLVNDLDIRITKDSETYYPWTLNPIEPFAPALNTEDNFRDNIEKIQVDNPVSGMYTITVSHKGNLSGGSQIFSLIVSGINQTLSTNSFDNVKFLVSPNPNRGVFEVTVSDFNPQTTLEIFDINGRIMYNQKVISSFSQIDASNLSKGVYFVRLNNYKNNKLQKIVIN